MDIIEKVDKFIKTKTGKNSDSYIRSGSAPKEFTKHIQSMANGIRSELISAAHRYWMSGALEDVENNPSGVAFMAALLYEVEKYKDIIKKDGLEQAVNNVLKTRT